MKADHVLWNLAGLGLPLVIAALLIPQLLALIGAERFGILALAWGMIGYASAIDLGIGRATTQKIASVRGQNDLSLVADILATATRITTLTGYVGMAIVACAALSGAHRALELQSVPGVEVQLSLLLLALALPMQALSATYRGVNEAFLNFRQISLLRVLLGVANFGAPCIVALFSTKVHWLVATLVLSRALALMFYRRFARSCIHQGDGGKAGRYSPELARGLWRFGGWFALSGLASPLLVQADRFFIGALLSASAVTLYVIPYEVVAQTLLVVGAVTTVVFPSITGLIARSPQEAGRVFGVWLHRLVFAMACMMALLAYLLPIILEFWVGRHISGESILVGRILCVGVVFNTMGSMYFSLLHGYGQSRKTAILHLIELPFFLAGLYLLIGQFGIVGAAIAWSLRMAADAMALAFLARGYRGLADGHAMRLQQNLS